jgi:hypothetical protein
MSDLQGTPVSVLNSTSLFQASIDAIEGAANSPFALAVMNALARPNITYLDFFRLVRTEVEALTDGFQTPDFFFANDIFYERKLVVPAPGGHSGIRRASVHIDPCRLALPRSRSTR